MEGIPSGYKLVLMDSAYFCAGFSDTVREILRSLPVYVGESFTTEVEEYRKVLSPERTDIYDRNTRFLTGSTQLHSLAFDSTHASCEHRNNDIRGLVEIMTEKSSRILVITANQLLIRRIVLSGNGPDIYDLLTDTLIPRAEFTSYGKRFMFSEKPARLTFEAQRLSTGAELYIEDGRKIRLGEEMKSGLEGSLFRVDGDPSSVAKIYLEGGLTPEKYSCLRDIAGINSRMDIGWARFPVELLYYDARCTRPAGFIEGYAGSEMDLGEDPLFTGDPAGIPPELLKMKQSELLELCMKIVRQICYLNTYGFYVTDFNLDNFAYTRGRVGAIQMWDTDSFGFGAYFPGIFSPDFVRRPIYADEKLINGTEAADIADDALYQFVFTILSLGDHPISEKKRTFKYDNPNYFALAKKHFLPEDLYEHMADVFRGNRKPSAEALMLHMAEALEAYRKDPSEDLTLGEMLMKYIPSYELPEGLTVRELTSEDTERVLGQRSSAQSQTTAHVGADPVSTGADPVSTGADPVSTGAGRKTASYTPASHSKHRGLWFSLGLAFAAAVFVFLSVCFGGPAFADSGDADHKIVLELNTSKPALQASKQTEEAGSEVGDAVTAEDLYAIHYEGWCEEDAVASIRGFGWDVVIVDEYSYSGAKGSVLYYSADDSTRTAALAVNRGPEPLYISDTDIKLRVTFENEKTRDLKLASGELAQVRITVTGDLPSTGYWMNISACPNIAYEWAAEWDECTTECASIGLNVYGAYAGSGYLRVGFVDGVSGEVLTYSDIYILVE